MIDVRYKKLTEDAIPFKYSREYDACLDIYANEDVILSEYPTIVHTGIAIQIPAGYEGIIRGRSGLASKGIMVHVGTIDENYRGEVGVIMFVNYRTVITHTIHKGDRIAQLAIRPAYRVAMTESEVLSETNRGENGFGSSGN